MRRHQKVGNISKCPVIISGGVSSIDDIKKTKDLSNKNIEGIIVGKAIYDGDIKLKRIGQRRCLKIELYHVWMLRMAV